MKVIITLGDDFKRKARRLAKKYHSFTDDLVEFKKSLLENPFQGANLGQGVHKVRMPITSKGKGKSGGARVLTLIVQVSDDAEVTLLTIYDKSEINNVSDSYIQALIRSL